MYIYIHISISCWQSSGQCGTCAQKRNHRFHTSVTGAPEMTLEDHPVRPSGSAAVDGLHMIPSSKRLHNYGKTQFLMGKSTINGHFQ